MRDAPEFSVGQAGRVIQIPVGSRVLDVGSGHNPHPRADTLLESAPEDDRDRGGTPMDPEDPRLVVGDACSMPFADASFDFIIASHIAEHVDDPAAFCRELVRVGTAGYIETPGWYGDRILREDYHRWRVRKHGAGLLFREAGPGRPFGALGEVFYRALYYDRVRPGHELLRFSNPILHLMMKGVSRMIGVLIRLPVVRDQFYTCFAWRGPFPVTVQPKPKRPLTVPEPPQGSSEPRS